MIQPKIIVIDGPDGVGKTTQVTLLESFLKQQGLTVHTTRASGGTPIGEELRKASLSNHPRHPETDLYISLAMHTELSYDITQRKSRGEVVIVDRSPLALLAYNTYGSQLPNKKSGYTACEKLLKLWQIDVFIFMDAPQQLLDTRRKKRGNNDYFEMQNSDYHHRVREGYEAGLELLKTHPDLVGEVVSVDAQGEAEALHREIIKTVAK